MPLQIESPSVACSEMVGRLEAAAALSVPRTTEKVTRSVAHCWWTEACSASLKQKHRTYNRYKRHKGDMKYFIEYKKVGAIFRDTILTARRTSWQSFVSTITVKTLSNEVWKKVRKLKGKPPNKAVVLVKEGNYISEPINIADLFARDFSRPGCLSDDVTSLLWQVETPTFSRGITPWYNNNFTYAELELALSFLTSSAPGPDNTPYNFLIHLNTQQRSQLLMFYNFYGIREFLISENFLMCCPYIRWVNPQRVLLHTVL